jgi:twinkle protein
VAGRGDAIVSAFWNAEAYRPDGIVSVRDIKETLFEPVTVGTAWPWNELTRLTYGRRKKHLYAFGAGVGVGKTDVFTECIAYDLMELKVPTGVIYLEQPVQETVQRVCGKIKSKLFHVPGAAWTPEEYRAAVDELEATDRLWLYQHFGSMDWETIKQKVRYFAKALGVEHIYLDHLTALTATADDERRALDRIMAEMAGLAHELDLIIHFISHLTTPDGKPHEEGGRVMEKHFTGSRAIARWSHYMIGLERNKQAEDIVERCTTTVRILKDRFTGFATGCTFPLNYNQQTGRLTESMF